MTKPKRVRTRKIEKPEPEVEEPQIVEAPKPLPPSETTLTIDHEPENRFIVLDKPAPNKTAIVTDLFNNTAECSINITETAVEIALPMDFMHKAQYPVTLIVR